MEIITMSDNVRNKLGQKLYMCLTILYELEDMFDYKERAISNCIDFLQHLDIVSANDIANDIVKEIANEKENN